MAFKLSVDEDILSVKTNPGILENLLFFKHWSYRFELPMNRISEVEVESRMGVETLIVHKSMADGDDKSIPISINKANKRQVRFIKEALPKIIKEKLPMPKIKELQHEYLDHSKATYL